MLEILLSLVFQAFCCVNIAYHIFEAEKATQFSHNVLGRRSLSLSFFGGAYLIWMSRFSISSFFFFNFVFSLADSYHGHGCVCGGAHACTRKEEGVKEEEKK